MRFLLPLRAGLPLIYVKLARVLNRSHFLMQAEESFDFQRQEEERPMLFQLLVTQRNVHRVNSEEQHLVLALLLLYNNFEKHFLMLVLWAFCVKSCSSIKAPVTNQIISARISFLSKMIKFFPNKCYLFLLSEAVCRNDLLYGGHKFSISPRLVFPPSFLRTKQHEMSWLIFMEVLSVS